MLDAARVRSLAVVLTARCNLRCAYCYQDRRPARGIDWTTLQRAAQLLLDSQRADVTLRFYGGEPLLVFDLARRAVEFAEQHRPASKRLRLALSTNGLLLDDARAAFLAQHQVETQLSFDGVPASQDRRGRGTFRVLEARLERLRERHPAFFEADVQVAVTLTGANLPHLAESIEYFLGKGVRTLFVGARNTHDPDWRPERIRELDEQFARIYRSCLRHYRRTGRVPLVLFRNTRAGRSRSGGDAMCALGRNGELAVDVDGQLAGCVVLAESYQSFTSPLLRDLIPSLRLGRLDDPDLPRRLAGFPRALHAAGIFDRKADKYSSYGRCRDCRYLRACLVCPVSIGHIPGNTDPRRVPDLPCAFNRIALKYRARFPRQPTAVELLQRGVLVPELARVIEASRLRTRVAARAPRHRRRRLMTALEHALGDLPARGRVLAQAEAVEHLVDERRLRVRTILRVPALERARAHEHDAAPGCGHREGVRILTAASPRPVGEHDQPQVALAAVAELVQPLAQRPAGPIAVGRQQRLAALAAQAFVGPCEQHSQDLGGRSAQVDPEDAGAGCGGFGPRACGPCGRERQQHAEDRPAPSSPIAHVATPLGVAWPSDALGAPLRTSADERRRCCGAVSAFLISHAAAREGA
jgi:sulfatase maturation enzyme AslB (radical SAM superfamily)